MTHPNLSGDIHAHSLFNRVWEVCYCEDGYAYVLPFKDFEELLPVLSTFSGDLMKMWASQVYSMGN